VIVLHSSTNSNRSRSAASYSLVVKQLAVLLC